MALIEKPCGNGDDLVIRTVAPTFGAKILCGLICAILKKTLLPDGDRDSGNLVCSNGTSLWLPRLNVKAMLQSQHLYVSTPI